MNLLQKRTREQQMTFLSFLSTYHVYLYQTCVIVFCKVLTPTHFRSKIILFSKKMVRWLKDGPHQKFLNNLFETKQLNEDSESSIVHNQYEIFQPFTRNTFCKHFNETRQKFLVSCK